MSSVKGQRRADRVRGRLCKFAFESLYGPLAWAYDWVSRTFFLGQWRLWQRATLTAALVGREAGVVEEAGVKLGRYVESQFPDGARVERGLVSAEEVLR